MIRSFAFLTTLGTLFGLVAIASVDAGCDGPYSPGYISGYSSSSSYPGTIATPYVATPGVIVQEVPVPSFSFQFLGSYAPQAAVPAAVAPPIAPQAVSPPVQAAAAPQTTVGPSAADTIAPAAPRGLSDADLEKLADLLARRLGPPAARDPDALPSLAPQDELPALTPAAAPVQQVRPAVQAASPRVDIEGRVVAALTQSCVQCHAASVARGGVALFDSTGAFRPMRTSGQPIGRAEIAQVILTGVMPPPERLASNPALRVPDDIKRLLAAWAGQSVAMR